MTDQNPTADQETTEGTAGPDPSNTPVENITQPLEAGDDAAEQARALGDTTVVEHTDEAMVLRDGVAVNREGGLGDGGEVLTGEVDEQDARKQLDGPATDDEKNEASGQ